MSEVKMAWALCSESLTKIHISNNNVVRNNNKNEDGTYKYLCLCHNLPVLAVKGTKTNYQKHFRHDTQVDEDEDLYFNSLTSHNESIVHKLGKKIFSELNTLNLPNPTIKEEEDFYSNFPFRKDLTGKIFSIPKPKIVQFFEFKLDSSCSKIEKELTNINVVPDVIIHMNNLEVLKENKEVAIEIFVTHEVDETKRNKYLISEFPCIQVDLSNFLKTIDQNLNLDLETEIKKYILNKSDIFDYVYFNFLNQLTYNKELFIENYDKLYNEHNNKIINESESQLFFASLSNKIVHISNSTINKKYLCLCCGQFLINKNNTHFSHIKFPNTCSFIKNKSSIIEKLLETSGLNLISKNINLKNQLVEVNFRYIYLEDRFSIDYDDDLLVNSEAVFDVCFTYTYNLKFNKKKIEKVNLRPQIPLSLFFKELSTNEYFFTEYIHNIIENYIYRNFEPEEKSLNEWFNEISRLNQIISFFNVPHDKLFCPLCNGLIKHNGNTYKHKNRNSPCSTIVYNDNEWNDYFSQFNKLDDIFLELNKLNKYQIYNCSSWNSFFKNLFPNLNLDKLKFKLLHISKNKNGINLLFEHNQKRLNFFLGYNSNNIFNKDLYFKLNKFSVKDLKYPLDISDGFYEYLKSILY